MGVAKIRLARIARWSGIATVLACCGISASSAASLRIEPVIIDVPPPGAAGQLTLHNDDTTDMTVQIRVYKWSQVNGKDELDPTTDVVASPPAIKLLPGNDYVARIVRTSKKPLQGEESYRILVDQLPQTQAAEGQVNLLIRQSIPVFFGDAPGGRSDASWSLAYDGNGLLLTAKNSGARRLRVSAVTLKDDAGTTVSFGDGLVGYVLSHSTASWSGPAAAAAFAAKGAIVLNGQGDTGPIHAVIPAPVHH